MVVKSQAMSQPSSRYIAVIIFVLVFVGLTVTTLSASISAIEFDNEYGPFLSAFPLSTVPDAYVSISNPDPYLLRAMSNPEETVFLPSSKASPKYDIISTHGNINSNPYVIEYNGAYYNIGVGSADPASTPFVALFIIAPAGWALFGVSLFAYLRWKKYSRH